jgi:hypothetical protein
MVTPTTRSEIIRARGIESGARGPAPTLYMNDPNMHLIEIRTYE